MFSLRLIRNFATSSLRASGASSERPVVGELAPGVKQWKLVSYLIALPGVALCMVNAYLKTMEEGHERQEFIPYEHMRIRNKRFPWGDGQKSLFHNSHVNALPGGYESEH